MLRLQCIDFNSDQRPWGYEGQMIRVAYLYADTVVVSGNSYFTMDFERQYGPDNSPQRKKMVIERIAKHVSPTAENEMAHIFRTQKEMQARKHKDRDTIVMIKRGEKLIEMMYTECVAQMRRATRDTGLPELMKLEDEEMHIKPGDNQKPEIRQPLYHLGSDILKEKWTGNDEVYALTNPFWDYLGKNNLSISYADKTNEPADVLMFRLPSVTILNYISATELKLLKRDLLPDPQNLRKAIASWSQALRTEDFSPAQFSSHAAYFASEIAPYLPDLEARIQAHEIHRSINDLHRGKAGSDVFLAIAKAKHVWDYLEWNKSVSKQSIHAFLQDLPAGCDENKTMLLFLCKSKDFSKELQEVSDKKSLQL